MKISFFCEFVAFWWVRLRVQIHMTRLEAKSLAFNFWGFEIE